MFDIYRDLGGDKGIVFLGRGTVSSDMLNLLGILDTRKEIFLGLIDEDMEDALYDELDQTIGPEQAPSRHCVFHAGQVCSSGLMAHRLFSPEKKEV